MKALANIISVVFHPLLMVTYGMMLAFDFTYLTVFHPRLKLFVVGGIFMCTAIVPALFILLMVRTGMASDLAISNRKERAIPYLTLITSMLVCIYYLHRMKMPFWLTAVFVGAGVALLIAMCINFYWKISAHTIGIGGLLGAVMGISHFHLINPYWGFICLFLIVGAVCTARIYMKRHTPMQTYAGACLGFICTFSAPLCSYFYLFI